jgi:hypothetical protein
MNYGTDHADDHGHSVLYGHDDFPGHDSNYPDESSSLLSANRYPHTHPQSPPPPGSLDPLKRFQQPPLLPRGGGGSGGSSSIRGAFSQQQYYQQQQQQYQQQQQSHTGMFAPSQNFWGRNNSDANFDPGLYAFSAIPRHRAHSDAGESGSAQSYKGFSPLDLQLQRDTSAQKYAAYAPHAPPPPPPQPQPQPHTNPPSSAASGGESGGGSC